ncbi:MAG: BREX system ATP-binding domain-containing protein [Desulfamplus sp.]
MITKEELENLKPFQARSIIEDLRKGSVPVEFVPLFTVGRTNWLTFIEDDLENYIAEGGSKVRFISGDYGDGKTHFMSVIQHIALERRFAISFIVLTREVPIHKFEIIYQNIVKGLKGSFEGIGIRKLLEWWLEKCECNIIEKSDKAKNQTCGHPISDKPENETYAHLINELQKIDGMDINFVNALTALVNNHFALNRINKDDTVSSQDIGEYDKNGEKESLLADREIILNWFEGGKTSKKELKPFQIYESLNKNNSKQFLNSLILFLRYSGHKGLILLFDEMETVIAQSASVRSAAYENIRLLIDNSESSKFLHIFFSIIPDLLISEKGFKSYDALWSRIRSIGETSALNFRGVLVDIHRTPLTSEELVALGRTLRTIHGNSYRWNSEDSVKDELIGQICTNQKQMGVLSEVRLFIKQLIRIFDMAEQGESTENIDMRQQIVEAQKEMEAEKLEQLQPSWDN